MRMARGRCARQVQLDSWQRVPPIRGACDDGDVGGRKRAISMAACADLTVHVRIVRDTAAGTLGTVRPPGDVARLQSRGMIACRGTFFVGSAGALGGSVGHRTIGARVNGGLVRLSSPLADGDLVELSLIHI